MPAANEGLMDAPKFRDRVIDMRKVRGCDLMANPKNWRTHGAPQREALTGLLAEVGIAGACVARELPDGTLQLIDGHLRAETAGEAELPVLVVDVTEAEADLLLAAFDPISAMAGVDTKQLDEILRSVNTESQALADMLTELAENNGLLKQVAEKKTEAKPELEISPELHERQDYLVVVFDNELDWLVACQRLGIETVKSGQLNSSTIEKTGVGRVITAQRLLEVMNG